MTATGVIEMKTVQPAKEKKQETEIAAMEDTLIGRYGPLMNMAQLASILDRSPEGLRITLRSTGEWVEKINATRLRLGRRVYFRTSEIAQVLGVR